MGWSGGIFTRVHDWTEDEAGGYDIVASRFDEEDDNFESGINACLTKDGSNTPTSNLPMGGKKHTGVDKATNRDDYATAWQVQNGDFNYATASYTLNAYAMLLIPSPAGYAAGQMFNFKAAGSNTGASTLNINMLGAKDIYYNNAPCTGGEIVINRLYSVIYDGTRFHLMGGGGASSGISFGGAKICMSSAQTISDNSWTTVAFRTELYDDKAFYTTGSSGFTIPTTGRYRISAGVHFEVESLDFGETALAASFAVNGSTHLDKMAQVFIPSASASTPSPWVPDFNLSWEGSLTAGDIITLKIYHENAAGFDRSIYGLGTERDSSWMAIERIL